MHEDMNVFHRRYARETAVSQLLQCVSYMLLQGAKFFQKYLCQQAYLSEIWASFPWAIVEGQKVLDKNNIYCLE